MRLILILSVFISSYSSTSVTNSISQDNKDVLILSTFVQDHLRKTNGWEINLTELLKKDTLNRISNSFETVELRLKGNLFVYYKFSEQRDAKKIKLNEQEKQLTSRVRWRERKLEGQYDGKIRFEYGERYYLMTGIFVQKPTLAVIGPGQFCHLTGDTLLTKISHVAK